MRPVAGHSREPAGRDFFEELSVGRPDFLRRAWMNDLAWRVAEGRKRGWSRDRL